MNEMIDTFLLLLGYASFFFIIVGSVVTLVDWKNNKYKKINTFDARRMKDNLEILEKLKKYIKDHPSQRFGQVLHNCGVINDVGVRDSSKPEWETPDYYISRQVIFDEPSLILKQMEKALANEYEPVIVIKKNKKNPSGGDGK